MQKTQLNCCALLLQSATKLRIQKQNTPPLLLHEPVHMHHGFALAFPHAVPQIIGLSAKPSLKIMPSIIVQKKQRKSQRLVLSCCLTFISVCVCICLLAFLALQSCCTGTAVCTSTAIACATSSRRANSRRLALRFGLSGLCLRGCSSSSTAAVRAGQTEENRWAVPHILKKKEGRQRKYENRCRRSEW